MSADIVEHLFDPYFTTKGDAGTGLGVPQVVAFMRASGGTVCVSTELGAGTCFDLRFPAADQGAQAGSQWRQLDRWANEGGNQLADRALPDERKLNRIAEPPRRSGVAWKPRHAQVPIAGRHTGMPEQGRHPEAVRSLVVPSFEPFPTPPARRHAS
jgi:hypothetical protein